jgi:hypothetical protein
MENFSKRSNLKFTFEEYFRFKQILSQEVKMLTALSNS